jgi:hypothetical protein
MRTSAVVCSGLKFCLMVICLNLAYVLLIVVLWTVIHRNLRTYNQLYGADGCQRLISGGYRV